MGPKIVVFRDRLVLERVIWRGVRKRLNRIEKKLLRRAQSIPDNEIFDGMWGEDAIERWLDDQLKEEAG